MKKLENTLENKEKFFAQYWGQKVMVLEEGEDYVYPVFITGLNETHYLLLTPLSQITDEDAIEVAVFGSIDVDLTEKSRDFAIKNGKHWAQLISENLISPGIHCLDYLRSKGYALPYMGLSVNDLIDYGWVKLKENA